MARALTTTATFLLTDIEGSSRLWEEHPDAMHDALARHDAVLREAFAPAGHVYTAGPDGFGVAFADAGEAAAAAVTAQRALSAADWPAGVVLRVRMGLDTGSAVERDDHTFVGPVLARAARIMAAAHGGQILAGARTASLLDAAELVDVGEHRLKDLPRAERLFQLRVDGVATEFAPPRAADAYRGNLPTPGSSLIGRAALVAESRDLVHSHRLVTLTGVGGVGKTRLAVEIATEIAADMTDGVWLVELAAVTDADAVPDAIATALGITAQAGVPLVETLVEALSGRRMLLVLDNCEHVLDAAAAAVEALLTRATEVRVLATSREALGVRDEHRRLVLPLTVDGGRTSPAVTLFVARAQALQSRIDFDEPATASAIVDICRSLDGLPLGIELAAARTISMSPVDLRDRLGDRFRILKSPQRTPQRQQTLRDVVAWSYDLLDEGERSALRHAAVFAGGFDVTAMATILGADELDVLDTVDSLVRKSLVAVDQSAGAARYVLLETIRQFAEDELTATGALEGLRDRHAAFFAAEATARWERWNGPGWRDSVDWLAVELANLRAAFRWSAGRGQAELATDVAAHAGLMGASVQLFETVGWAQELLEEATRADVRHLPRLYTAAAWGCFTGAGERAVSAAQQAAVLERDPRYEPCEPGLSGLIEALAQVYSGHLDRYVEAAERVVLLPGNARAWGLPLLVDGLQASGRVDEAIALTDEALAAARALGNPYFIAYSLWTTGTAFHEADPMRALTVWREGLDYVHQHRVDFFVGFIARDAARLRLVDADPDDALTMFDAAIDAFEQAGNVVQLIITLASATALFERLEQRESAATLYGAIVRQPGSDHHVPELPELAGRLAASLGGAAFQDRCATGATMDLGDTADFARLQIAAARAELRARATVTQSRPGGLSARELDVLRLAASGLSTREIAERLYISAKTADRHVQNLYTKIGVSNRAAATRWATQHGVVD